MKILVIDDEEMILSLVTKILTRQDYEVETAYSGEEGLEIYAHQVDNIDLVLIDQSMPGISGMETLGRLREISPDLPCIISSGQLATRDDLPENQQNRVYFLQKPYRADQLSDIVSSITLKEPTPKSC